ncbi:hypothetical protein [Blastococcus sp. PRF04-17]|uniref:hypothetical protein n=1 Tax=Blastococcus sp. PRF04-17 TaxID=2933797 RepID=UPI001FF5463E|nr:hypothetical protein [Blastococcus sp. PRF04-17]UOY00641.1 hypothetical protein MVA48_16820 [Blastococcus sp. PRF04-17]
MTSADVQVHLRPPAWARGWVAVFPILFAGMFLFVIRPDGSQWLFAVVVFVFSPVLAWRLFRLAAIGTGDGRLVVRNHWRDRTLHRDEVAEVGVTKVTAAGNRSVGLRLRDGSMVRLDVTETPFGGRRLQRQEAAVRDWVAGRPQPFL